MGCRGMVSSLTEVDQEPGRRGSVCRGDAVWMWGQRQQCWQLERLPDRSTGFCSTQLFPGALLCSCHLALMHSSCGTTPLQLFA